MIVGEFNVFKEGILRGFVGGRCLCLGVLRSDRMMGNNL